VKGENMSHSSKNGKHISLSRLTFRCICLCSMTVLSRIAIYTFYLMHY